MKTNTKGKLLIILFYITLVTIGCKFNSKENYLQNFTDFISEIENNYKTYTEEDWNTKEIEYKKLISEKYDQIQSQLTDEDQQTIGKLKARYFKIVLKSGLEQLEEDIKEGAKQLEGFIEEMTDSISN